MAAATTRVGRLLVVAMGFLVASCSSDAPSGAPAASVPPSTTARSDEPTSPSTTGATTLPTTTTPSVVTNPTTTNPTTTVTAMTTMTTTTIVVTTTTAVPQSTTPPSTTAPAPAPVPAATVAPTREGSITDVRAPSDIPAPPLPDGWATRTLGMSVQGRDITALVRSVDSPTRGVLVVGGIHGNEPASPPTVRAFVNANFGDDVAVWLVPELNPDGVAAGTRWNANGVDLNRNFSWDWRASDGGPAPMSEPESRAIGDFIAATRPGIVVWVHQPYGYVSSVADTARAFEAAWSTGSGLPTRSGVTQHGGGESWTFFEAELPSMLIEIDTWAATDAIVAAQLGGFQGLLAELGWDE